jgi:SIR2-like domain
MTSTIDDDRPSLREETWQLLVASILRGTCTPFLGAGVSVPHLPRGSELAITLAQAHEYPFADHTNLARVSQYIASTRDSNFLKTFVLKHLEDHRKAAGQFLRGNPPENHLMLARLELPLYITSNYDDYLEDAIGQVCLEPPVVEICRWSDRLVEDLGKYRKTEPVKEHPTIFHLHGHMSKPRSMLMTEDDYIDFTVSLSERPTSKPDPIIPHFIRRALGDTNLLFLGYSLDDWNFRVLMRHLIKQQKIVAYDQNSYLSIQLSDKNMSTHKRRLAEEFLEKYLRTSASIDVYWGDAQGFLEELLRRVERARRVDGDDAA